MIKNKEIKVRVNTSHYYAVRSERIKQGLPVCNFNIEVKDHPLVGKYVVDNDTNDKYKVEEIRKQWHGGWYYAAILERNKSHVHVFWQNISAVDDLTIEFCEESQKKYKVLK